LAATEPALVLDLRTLRLLTPLWGELRVTSKWKMDIDRLLLQEAGALSVT
jgi:hypothetical protein